MKTYQLLTAVALSLFGIDDAIAQERGTNTVVDLPTVREPQRPNVTLPDPTPVQAARVYAGSFGMSPTSSNSCMEGESGIRRQTFTVRFRQPFSNSIYAVALGIRAMDIDHNRNARIQANVVNKSRDQMTLEAVTWCDTVIYGATIDYIAVGE